ncbi:thiamine-phosphate kinase [Thiorhodovibrio frisius]|uniref:Thiamine-monophosphate kinase n=1 Tax=Thiorhodovibrio frisius TaxID=631362 RepID=H8Z1H3_9GAMM|nr:thiamine-phosphate kinase [Thiorhodovibrio frisius]EIC22522.1 thiamine-monophosphate kinase [Thiorhodovibrio frisius]WPL19961.1 Thiamine-monophosphate kinase [Thiorhodovibrio frisius]
MSNSSVHGEFALIRDFLTGLGAPREDVLVDIGDDCALTRLPPGFELAFSIDTLVSGRHFFPDCDPTRLGHKSLAVGLSDLAAMGATPAWATLALTIPQAEPLWLQAFAQGLHRLACRHSLRLVGGDLTRGPLTISIQVMGLVKPEHAILRSGASPGDAIMVSGTLGDAGLALQSLLSRDKHPAAHLDPQLRDRLERPTPRVALGCQLVGIASAAIDVSDGLVADLGHLLDQSRCGANLELAALPLTEQVARVVTQQDDWAIPLTSGDDYELCFTVPQENLDQALALDNQFGCSVTIIGQVTEAPNIRLVLPDGQKMDLSEQKNGPTGFDHFCAD